MHRHLELFMERFPLLGLLSRSFPVEEHRQEDFSHWPGALPDVEVLYVYGLSLEAYQLLSSWVHAAPQRKLLFLEDREGQFGALLQSEEALPLVEDLQVELHLLPQKKNALNEALEKLAKEHPVTTLDIIALPSRNTRHFRFFREQLFRKTMLAEAIRKDRLHGYQLFWNFVCNAPHLKNSFYVNALRGAFEQIPAIICGAGPSLASAFATLEKLEHRALIIACGSAITACSAAGITPHICIAVDPNEEEFSRLKDSFAFEVPFFYSTRIHPHVFSTLNGPFGYVRSQFGDVSQLWLEEELGLTEPFIGHQLSSESISVTSMAVAILEHLGCNPILFAGMDMAYTANQRYCSSVGVRQTAQEKHTQITADRLIQKKDRQGKKVHSAVRWIMESSSLSHYATLHPHVRFINTTEGGIGFSKIPYQSLESAVNEFQQQYDLRGMMHAAISRAPLPSSTSSIPQQLSFLKESLLRVIEHLQVLSGEKKGSQLLAELDMKEETAYSVLFYDMLCWLSTPKGPNWPACLELACRYLEMMGL